jgi:hypothetical protein
MSSLSSKAGIVASCPFAVFVSVQIVLLVVLAENTKGKSKYPETTTHVTVTMIAGGGILTLNLTFERDYSFLI